MSSRLDDPVAYFHQGLERSVRFRLSLGGIPLGEIDDLVAACSGMVWIETRGEEWVTAREVWLLASAFCTAEIQKWADQARLRPAVGSVGTATEILDQKALTAEWTLRELEAYRLRRDRLLAPTHPYYRGKDPLLALYDARLVARWEQDPAMSLREHGRILRAQFAEEHPDCSMARVAETLACRRLASFLGRLIGPTPRATRRKKLRGGLRRGRGPAGTDSLPPSGT